MELSKKFEDSFLNYSNALKEEKDIYGKQTIIAIEIRTKKGIEYELIVKTIKKVTKLSKLIGCEYCHYLPHLLDSELYLICLDQKSLINLINRFSVNCIVLDRTHLNSKLIKPKYKFFNKLFKKSFVLM